MDKFMKEDQNFGTSNFNNLAQKMDYIFGINKYKMHFSRKGTKGARFLASEMSKIGIFWRSKKVLKANFQNFRTWCIGTLKQIVPSLVQL